LVCASFPFIPSKKELSKNDLTVHESKAIGEKINLSLSCPFGAGSSYRTLAAKQNKKATGKEGRQYLKNPAIAFQD